MSSTEDVPSYDDLVRKIKSQEILMQNYFNNSNFLSDFNFRLEHSSDLICSISFDGKVLELNSVLSNIVGNSQKAFKNKSFYSLFHQEDSGAIQSVFIRPERSILGFEFKGRLKRGDEQVLNSSWIISELNTELKIIYLTGYAVSPLHAVGFDKIGNDMRFRTLVENNEGIITVFSPESKVLFRSSSSFRTNGYTDEEFIKLSDEEYYHPDYIEIVKNKINESLQSPATPIFISFKVKHKKGHYIWLEGVITNMLHDQYIQGIIANFKDVTENKRLIDT